jgi:hypothetical protein
MAVVAVATLTAGHAAASPAEPAGVVLHVTDYAQVPAGELLEAERLASQVYERIGVRIIWTGGWATEATADSALQLDVIILNAKMTAQRRPARPMALGEAGHVSRRAFIHFARVIDHAIETRSDPRLVLGLVLAHEVGHMLLPEYSHTPSGLMRADWKGRLTTIPDFLPAQAAEIRSQLTAEDRPH